MPTQYPDHRTEQIHQYLIKVWSFLPEGRTYTVRQAEKKARDINETRIIKAFQYMSDSAEINPLKVGRFLLRTTEFSHKSRRIVSVDRGNMKAWHLIPSDQPDTLVAAARQTDGPEEGGGARKIVPIDLAKAWRELPGHSDGLTVREAVNLATKEPGRFPRLSRILSLLGQAQKARALESVLKRSSEFISREHVKTIVKPRRRLRLESKTRRSPRAYVDPSLFSEKWVWVYRTIPEQS